jgi:hypothetical protein
VGGVQLNSSSVALDDLTGYGEAEAGSTGDLRSGSINADESFEDLVSL